MLMQLHCFGGCSPKRPEKPPESLTPMNLAKLSVKSHMPSQGKIKSEPDINLLLTTSAQTAKPNTELSHLRLKCSDCGISIHIRTKHKQNIHQAPQMCDRNRELDKASFMLRKPHCNSSPRFGSCHHWITFSRHKL